MQKKVMLVTGASKGIGLQVVLEGLRQGYQVVGTSRNAAQLQEIVQKELPEKENSFLALEMSFEEKSMSETVQKIIETFGRIDALVNNAGYAILGAAEAFSMEEVKANFDINFFGLLYLTQQVLPYMRQQQSGKIINLASISASVTGPTQGIYSATKAAVLMLSEALSMELAPFNVHAVAVCPGGVRTDFLDKVSVRHPEKEIPEYQNVTQTLEGFKRLNHSQMGDPKKVAQAIVTLCQMAQPPRRIYLGSGAVAAMEYHLNHVVEEMNQMLDLSQSTDF